MDNIVEEEKQKIKENLITNRSIEVNNNKQHHSYEVKFIISAKDQVSFEILFNQDEKIITLKIQNTNCENIKYNDVVGAYLNEKSKILNPNFDFNNSKLLILNFFPNVRMTECNCCGIFCCKCCQNITVRKVKTYEFLVNENTAQELSHILNSIASKNNYIVGEIPYKRKYIVFINPIGGKGKAIATWNHIREVLDKSYINLQLIRTQYYKHAYELVLKLDRNECDGILCVSGDGIVHEVVNAILHRPDSASFNIPIGVIPAGTSNGLAKAICDSVGEDCNPLVCSYFCVKGQTIDIDLVEIETISSQTKIYSFLGIAYGFIADVDLESEVLRCCGSMRFDLYGLWRLICLRKYFADFYYLPQNCEEYTESSLPDFNTKLPSCFVKISDSFKYFLSCHQKFLGQTINCTPRAKIDDGYTDLVLLRGNNNGKANLTKLLLNQDKGDYFDENGEIRRGSGVRLISNMRLIPKQYIQQTEEEIINTKLRLPRFYSIDGERYPIEPIQVRVLNKRLKVFCLNN